MDKITGQPAMADSDNERLDRQFDRLEGILPKLVGRFLRRLREPSSRWVRIPVGIVLIGGGVFSSSLSWGYGRSLSGCC